MASLEEGVHYLLAINLVDAAEGAERRKLALFRHGGKDVHELYGLMEFMALIDGEYQPTEIDEGKTSRELNNVLAKFQEYCNPRSSIMVSRFDFHKCEQDGTTIDAYLIKL